MPDTDALERKRLREAEEWRLKQLRAGVSSEDNSNFQVNMVLRLVQMPVIVLRNLWEASEEFPAPKMVCLEPYEFQQTLWTMTDRS